MNIFRHLFLWMAITGDCSENGFALFYCKNPIYTKMWEKSENNISIPSRVDAVVLTIFRTSMILLILLFVYLVFINLKQDLPLLKLASSLMWSLFYTIGAAFFIFYLVVVYFIFEVFKARSQTRREYHACEHMAIALLRSRKALTLQNLQKMSRISTACSTTAITLMMVFPPWIFIFTIQIWKNPALVVILAVMTFFLFCACFSISWAIQRFNATAVPSKEKLMETLAVVKIFDQIFLNNR